MSAVGMGTVTAPRPLVLVGSVLDLTDYLDTCGPCDGQGFVPALGGGEWCGTCRGTGLARLCPDCDGHGHTDQVRRTTCDTCDGCGQVA